MFKYSLGIKKRWPLSVVLGAAIDFDIPMNHNQLMNYATTVGMTLFDPQDVSGWDISNVWTLNRIS